MATATTEQLAELIATFEARADLAQQTADSLRQLTPAEHTSAQMARDKLVDRSVGEAKAYREAADLLRGLLS